MALAPFGIGEAALEVAGQQAGDGAVPPSGGKAGVAGHRRVAGGDRRRQQALAGEHGCEAGVGRRHVGPLCRDLAQQVGGGGALAAIGAGIAERQQHRRMVRRQRGGMFEGGHRFGRAAEGTQGNATGEPGIRLAGIERQSTLGFGQGGSVAVGLGQVAGQGGAGMGILGCRIHRLLAGGERGGVVVGAGVQVSQAEHQPDVARALGQHGAQEGDRLRDEVAFGAGARQRKPRIGMARAQQGGLAQHLACLRGAAGFAEQHAQQVEPLGLVRRKIEGSPIVALGGKVVGSAMAGKTRGHPVDHGIRGWQAEGHAGSPGWASMTEKN
jgi:hypothetical protein